MYPQIKFLLYFLVAISFTCNTKNSILHDNAHEKKIVFRFIPHLKHIDSLSIVLDTFGDISFDTSILSNNNIHLKDSVFFLNEDILKKYRRGNFFEFYVLYQDKVNALSIGGLHFRRFSIASTMTDTILTINLVTVVKLENSSINRQGLDSIKINTSKYDIEQKKWVTFNGYILHGYDTNVFQEFILPQEYLQVKYECFYMNNIKKDTTLIINWDAKREYSVNPYLR